MKTSHLIADFLVKHDITTVFGIIGSANAHLYDAFVSHGIKIVNVHHEQCAVIAAGAYYRTCNKLAIALVTAGGGATNAITGVVSLWADSIPCIILTGQESTKYIVEHSHRRMYGTQGFDVVKMTSGVVKSSKTTSADSIQVDMEEAYSIALSDRPGPVIIDIPFDVQSYDVCNREWKKYTHITTKPSIDEITLVQQLFVKSKKPVLLAGHGVKLSGGKDAIQKLVKIPTMLSWSSIDLIDHDNPLYFGMPGIYGNRMSNYIIEQCDLLLVIGSRLALPQTGYSSYANSATIIMVDIDPTEVKPFVDVHIKSDCLEFIKAFDVPNEFDYVDWIHQCNLIKQSNPIIESCHKIDQGFPNSYMVIDRISDLIKHNHVIVTDMGTALLSGHQAIRLKKDNTMFSSYGLGEMGYGLPAAIGAAFATPERPIMCLNCDGSMMMNLQELQTIIQHKLNIKIIIFNNDGYLMIKHTQNMLFNGKYNAVNSDTGIVLPEYMKISQAFGFPSFRIKTWTDFDVHFTEFMNVDGPSICEIFMPQYQDFVPKLKGICDKNGKITPPRFDEMSPLCSTIYPPAQL